MDLFDKLPDDLLIHIISFLPTKYAVLTSVLSRRWKLLWCFANNSLVFDDRHSFIDYIRDLEDGYDITDRVLSLHNFIERVLKLNKTPRVDKFFLMMYSFLRDSDAITSWLDWIVNKLQAKEIEIYFNIGICMRSPSNKVLFPITIFNSTSLRVLKLCFWNDRPLRVSCNIKSLFLPNLKVLHFFMEKIPWLLIHLIRASPQLEVAYFGGFCLGADKRFFKIYAPSLKKLCMKFRSINALNKFYINAPFLEELVIVDETFQHYIIKSNRLVNVKLDIGPPFIRKVQRLHPYIKWVCKLLRGLSHVKSLNLKAHTMNALSISCGREYFNLTRFLSLVRLQLCFLNYSSWDVLPKLLECAPNLEVLVISKDFKGKDSEFSKDSTWVQPSNVPACLLSSLRQVQVLDCESNRAEFELISYLLRHGETLSTFLVELLPANSRHDLRFRDDLMKIPMVSRTCELKISAYPHCSHRTSFSSEEKDCSSTQLQRRVLPQEMCFDDLKLCTNHFSNENLIARTEDFKVFRGKLYESDADDSSAKNVVVKKWVIPAENPYNEHKEYAMLCFREELKLSKHPNFTCHPNFMSLLGYCAEDSNERLGMIYDFNPLDHLENLIPKDSFTWLHRIKVALILACIMEYMHKKHGDFPSVTPRISPSSVIIDENYMPILFDFNWESGRYAKEDMYDYSIGKSFDRTRIDYDVENYGLTLFALISKRDHRCPNGKRHTSECETLDRWAMLEHTERCITSSLCKSEVPLVHRELMNDPKYDSADGLKLTRLTMRCLETFQCLPSMQAIVKYLCKLRVVRENWDVIDHNNAISNYLNVQVS